MKLDHRILFHIIMFTGFVSCGVNTGNPGTKKTEVAQTPPAKSPDTAPGTTIVLSLKEAPAGQVVFNVKRVDLIPSGEGLVSSKINSIVLPSITKMRSGQTVTLFSKQTVPSGTYDRISLVLDESAPAVFVDANLKENRVAIAPYRYYASSGEAVNMTQVVLGLAENTFKVDTAQINTVTLNSDIASTLGSFANISGAALEYYRALNEIDYLYTLDPTSQRVEVSTSTSSSSASTSGQIPSPISSSTPKANVSLEITVSIDLTLAKYICLYNKAQAYTQTTIFLDTACQKATAVAELTKTSGMEYAAFALASGIYDVTLRTADRQIAFLSLVSVDNVTTTVVAIPVDFSLKK